MSELLRKYYKFSIISNNLFLWINAWIPYRLHCTRFDHFLVCVCLFSCVDKSIFRSAYTTCAPKSLRFPQLCLFVQSVLHLLFFLKPIIFVFIKFSINKTSKIFIRNSLNFTQKAKKNRVKYFYSIHNTGKRSQIFNGKFFLK